MAEEVTKFIVFKLNNQSFGVAVQQVISIERLQEVTAVPRSSKFIKGVTELRGETTPVIDLKERLMLTESATTNDTRILVVSVENMQIGLIVDAATEVKDIEQNQIQAAPKLVAGIHETFLKGVAKVDNHLLILLDLERIVDLNESNELREAIMRES
ncbi:chemotaxis protein CheW [Oceanobacillus profundus]|uniref:Purine-binding chemotaxis protein CheW n=1 Tax=Oceanobacillus profundus TaxID=372463 RepID=A0A417Y9X7_9BACI|nr:chemotaxis protein CheW [Oceanobacillus profundus]MBR3117925.1 purine-binding chemotaxis protein CheW [Oceanobacillus sp.]PAE28767.1 chemotaxis protein CheW [Paenibacillus sp. 7884-2]MCM3397338.1 chemotaxis protein CheW [Oceanobacillus profundus]MDO6451535.1 chemotaxis protein CheW [Oceanobacillus profundus]RHW29385.1 purine-binding chemotaxis protein CheW [Oceanobacillus profundus]